MVLVGNLSEWLPRSMLEMAEKSVWRYKHNRSWSCSSNLRSGLGGSCTHGVVNGFKPYIDLVVVDVALLQFPM